MAPVEQAEGVLEGLLGQPHRRVDVLGLAPVAHVQAGDSGKRINDR